MLAIIRRICAVLVLMFLFAQIAYAQADIIYNNTFNTATDFWSINWETNNGNGVRMLVDNGNKYINMNSPGEQVITKKINPISGTIVCEMKLLMKGAAGNYIRLIDNTNTPRNLLFFHNSPNNQMILFNGWSVITGVTFSDNVWIGMKIIVNTATNKFDLIFNEDVNGTGHYHKIASNWGLGAPDGSPYDFRKISGIEFYSGSIGKDFNIDDVKIYSYIPNNGLDENFNSYDNNINNLDVGWDANNISIENASAKFGNVATLKNTHSVIDGDTIKFMGDIKIPQEGNASDSITVKAISGVQEIGLLNITGDKTINGQLCESISTDRYFHYEMKIIKATNGYSLKIGNVEFISGTIVGDFSSGVTGLKIQTQGNKQWYVDNIKTAIGGTIEQEQEVQMDLDQINISLNEAGNKIELPLIGDNGSVITWQSSNISIVNPITGDVVAPAWEEGITTVILTASASKYGVVLNKDFSIVIEPTVKNLFINGDCEQVNNDGTPMGWVSNASKPLVSSDVAHGGNKSILVYDRSGSTQSAQQALTLKPNRSYYFSAYVRLKDEATADQTGRIAMWMDGTPKVNAPFGSNSNFLTDPNQYYMKTDEWINMTSTFDTNVTPQMWPASTTFFPFAVGSTNLDFYLDDVELYEFVLKKLQIVGVEEVIVPSSGTSKTEFRAEATNQFDTDIGMKNLQTEWSIEGDSQGILIDNNGELSLSEYTCGGIITLNCKVKEGTISGSSWVTASKQVKIVNQSTQQPKAYDLSIKGNVANGNSIVADYKYFQKDNVSELNSIIKWYASDTFDGQYIEIIGKNTKNLSITSDLTEKFLKFSVIPKTTSGFIGNEYISKVITKTQAPIAKDVKITGNASDGKKIVGEYQFQDFNYDEEGNTTFRWLMSDKKDIDYQPIEGATQKELICDASMTNKYIKFEVTPISLNIPFQGVPVTSEFAYGLTAPTVSNLTVYGTGSVGEILSVRYDYFDVNNDVENSSIIKWYDVNGTLLATSSTFVPNSNQSGMDVYAEVTPIASSIPTLGTPVKSSIVTIKTNGVKISKGGSSSGSISTMPILPTVSGEVISTTDNTNITLQDIKGHWAEKDINDLVKLGILKGKTESVFAPDDNITRAEFISIIVRCINVNIEKYNNAFTDVDANKWYSNNIQIALANNIISKSNEFRPNDFITREELAKVIAKAYQLTMNNQWPLDYNLTKFEDNSEVSEWAVGYIGGCLELGFIKGTSNTKISSKDNATRGQVAVIVNRFINAIY